MQIQKSHSNPLVLPGIYPQNAHSIAKKPESERVNPVPPVKKVSARNDRHTLEQHKAVYERAAASDVPIVQTVVRKSNFGRYSDPKTYAALSAYSAEANTKKLEEQTILSKLLGVDYYV